MEYAQVYCDFELRVRYIPWILGDIALYTFRQGVTGLGSYTKLAVL